MGFTNYSSRAWTIDCSLYADDVESVSTTVEIEPPDDDMDPESVSEDEIRSHQQFLEREWPETGSEFEAVGTLSGAEREFRTTVSDEADNIGLYGAVHPGRDALGWFVDRIDEEDIEEYREWVENVTR